MKNLLADAATGVLVACAVVITGLAVRRELGSAAPAPTPYTVQMRSVPNWRSYAEGQRIGPADARVKIVEFSDFQCPYCRTMSGRLRAIQEAHPGKVALLYRHFPLSYHPHARPAAHASVCAEAQGRFADFHDLLFARQDSLGSVAWSRIAADAGVADLPEFERCLTSESTHARVESDVQAAARLGISGTPTLLVNGVLITEAAPGLVEEQVERALKASKTGR